MYFDPCYKTFKSVEAAKMLFDEIGFFSDDFDCQIINPPRLNSKNIKSDFVTEENRNKSAIIKFDSIKNFKYEYGKVFNNLKSNPVPKYYEEKVSYNDYGIIKKEQEKVELKKIENEDIFTREKNNFVKEDVILNIMKKLNKN